MTWKEEFLGLGGLGLVLFLGIQCVESEHFSAYDMLGQCGVYISLPSYPALWGFEELLTGQVVYNG